MGLLDSTGSGGARLSEKSVDPHVFVVFGGRGDLMTRKLLPALYHLTKQGYLHERCRILGVARTDGLSDDDFRKWRDV